MTEHIIWLVMRITQASIPECWCFTESEANRIRDALSERKETGTYYFVMPVSDSPLSLRQSGDAP